MLFSVNGTGTNHIGIHHLEQHDPVMSDLIQRVGSFQLQLKDQGTHLDYLIRAIIYQQLSGKAAETIHGRLERYLRDLGLVPESIAELPDQSLRDLGISSPKVRYMKDLVTKATSGQLSLEALVDCPDDEVIDVLTSVKGIGRWTAQMFLMFRLGRSDVLPESDLSIQKAIMIEYQLPGRPTPAEVLRIGEAWRPFRSVASWYLYRSLD